MIRSVTDLIGAANAIVPRIGKAEAEDLIEKTGAIVVDVRDAPEIEKTGKIAGSIHVSRGCWNFALIPAPNTTTRHSRRIEPLSSIVRPADGLPLAARYSRIWATRMSTISAHSRIGLRPEARWISPLSQEWRVEQPKSAASSGCRTACDPCRSVVHELCECTNPSSQHRQ